MPPVRCHHSNSESRLRFNKTCRLRQGIS